MILNKKRKLQLGGAMTEYVPLDLRVQDKTQLLRPQGGGAALPSSGRSSAPAVSSLDKAKALRSDREALRQDIEETKAAIRDGVTANGKEFTSTEEYKALSQRLRMLSTTSVANLESDKNKYTQVYQASKKAAEGGDMAIFGDKVFVLDNSTGAYDIVDKKTAASAMTDVHGKKMVRFVPQSVATALQVRADDATFALNRRGGELEEIIRGVQDSESLQSSMDKAFKGTGYSKGLSTSIVTDQGKVSISDLLKYQSELDTSPKAKEMKRSNQAQLDAARQTFIGALEGPMREALKDKAWDQYYRQYAGKQGAPDANTWVNNQVDKMIGQTMSKYLRTEYADDLKKGDGEGEGGQDITKISVTVDNIGKAMYGPTGSTPVENKEILEQLEGKPGNKDKISGILHMPSASVPSIDEAYNKKFPADVPKTLQNSYFMNGLVGSPDAWHLPDGTPLNSLQDGAAAAVKVPGKGVTILHKVPMVKDPQTGGYSIAWDIMSDYATFDSRVKELKQKRAQQLVGGGKSQEDAEKQAEDETLAFAKVVAKNMGLPDADGVELRTAVMTEILLPSSEISSDKEHLFSSKVSKANETTYEGMNPDGLGMFSDLKKTVVIAPTNNLSQVLGADFGLRRDTMKLSDLLNQLGVTQKQSRDKWDKNEYVQTLINNTAQ